MMALEFRKLPPQPKPLRPANEFLSGQEYKLWAIMTDAGVDVDVKIADLFNELFVRGVEDGPLPDQKSNKQEYVGAVISRVNRKMLCYRPLIVGQFVMSECIVPGELKRTYRLVIK